MQATRPRWRAAIIAAGYAVAASAYIYASSAWVAARHLGPADQAWAETLKGLGFVAVTSLALFAVLATQFRRLREARDSLVERTQALGRAERRAATALVSAAVAHDMKNQLTVAMASHDVLAQEPLSGDAAEARDDLGACLERLLNMSRELMQRANEARDERRARVDLGRVAARASRMVRFWAVDLERPVEVVAEEPCEVEADERDLDHAVLNLVLNAVQATDGRGMVRVTVRCVDSHAVIEVADDGPGVPAEHRLRIFQPFFTTKPEGSGLGLASVRQVVDQLRGHIEVLPREPRGTCFRVMLPRPGVTLRSTPPAAPSG